MVIIFVLVTQRLVLDGNRRRTWWDYKGLLCPKAAVRRQEK